MLTSEPEQMQIMRKSGLFSLRGRDKKGRLVLRVLGKSFPAKTVSVEVLKKFMEENLFPKLRNRPFVVLYMQARVEKGVNCPGISALKSIVEAVPAEIKQNLEAVYFLHAGFHARIFMATFGRFIFSGGLYGKLKYMNRVYNLWDYIDRREIEIPEYVMDYDEHLEYQTIAADCIDSDHPRRPHCGIVRDDSYATPYSLRCIA